VTKALSDLGKNLFDYEAVNKVIAGSGFFVQLAEELKDVTTTSTSVTIDTQIVEAIVGGLTGNALAAAKGILKSLGSKLTIDSSSKDSKSRVAHLQLFCQYLFGLGTVCVKVYGINIDENQTSLRTPCIGFAKQAVRSWFIALLLVLHWNLRLQVKFVFKEARYLFVSPSDILKFSKDLATPAEFNNVVDKIKENIQPANPPQPGQ